MSVSWEEIKQTLVVEKIKLLSKFSSFFDFQYNELINDVFRKSFILFLKFLPKNVIILNFAYSCELVCFANK